MFAPEPGWETTYCEKTLYAERYENNQSLTKSEGPTSLPNWLKDKREMVFLKKCIVKGKLLGKGQFGNVYKGKLHQGNAV